MMKKPNTKILQKFPNIKRYGILSEAKDYDPLNVNPNLGLKPKPS